MADTEAEERHFRTHCTRCGGRFLTPRVRPTLCEECADEVERLADS